MTTPPPIDQPTSTGAGPLGNSASSAATSPADRRSRARGDNDQQHQSAIHRGLLFGSGLVAGEAIASILIAFLIIAKVPMPWMPKSYMAGGWWLDLLSLAALAFMMWMLMRKSLARSSE